jgi:hypothetical protein
MKNEAGALDMPICKCGCGVQFGAGSQGREFATPACRARFWRTKNLRVIRNLRPRAKRLRVGREFQLSERHLRTLIRYQHMVGAADLSAALRSLLVSIEGDV